MRIRIITIHNIPNFGSVFQSYALCKYLISQGYEDTKIIDYNPDYYNKCTIRAVVGKILNYGAYRRRTKRFRDFVKKYIPITMKNSRILDNFQILIFLQIFILLAETSCGMSFMTQEEMMHIN